MLLMLVLATAVNCSLIQPPASAAAVAWQPASSDAPPADDGSSEDGRSEDAESKMLLLKKLLYDLGIDYVENRKRSCRVNLGGHCATEEAASMAKQWHFLNSGMSPGRRRRRRLDVQPAARHDDVDDRSMTSSHLQSQSQQLHPGEQLDRT